jgi:hypothetical protein
MDGLEVLKRLAASRPALSNPAGHGVISGRGLSDEASSTFLRSERLLEVLE